MKELALWIALRNIPGLRRPVARRLLARYGTPGQIFGRPLAELGSICPARPARALSRGPGAFLEAARAELNSAERQGLRLLRLDQNEFPPLLEQIPDAPLLLWLRGKLPAPEHPLVAVVGSRRPSESGAAIAKRFASCLVDAGAVVVSGLAYGIDAAAHRGALEAGGTTLAFLASGLNRPSPAGNLRLARDLLAQGGAWLSEYPPDASALPGRFPERNRLISEGVYGGVRANTIYYERSRGYVRYLFDGIRPITPCFGAACFRSASGDSTVMATVKLTKRVVATTLSQAKEFVLWDASLPGFGLRVYPNGSRAYCVQYRYQGRTRKMALGSHRRVTLAQARARAKELLSRAVLGQDPVGVRVRARSAPTVRDLAERYLIDYARVKNKPSSVREAEKIFGRHILPSLGDRRVPEVTRTDVEHLRNSLRKTKHQANRVVSLLRKMMNLAEDWGIRPEGSNPCRGVERYPEPGRERFLSDSELSRLGEAMRVIEQREPRWKNVIAAIRVIALTGARRNEILKLRWEDVDWERAELNLSDSKTGPKTIVLNAPAAQIFQSLRKDPQSPNWIFPAPTKDVPFTGIASPWTAIREEAGLDVRLHDLRHSYASAGARSGLSLPQIGAVLGHSTASTTARYTHLDSEPIHRATEIVGSRISAALEGHPDAPVVAISEPVAKRKVTRS